MDYHLNRDGQDLGVFPLEELRRRRAIGELTGSELVWSAGMTDWQTLELVLLQNKPAGVPPPIPQYNPKSDGVPVWLIVGSIVAFIGILTLIGVRLAHIAKNPKAISPVSLLPTVGRRHSAASDAASAPVKVNAKSITEKEVNARQKEFRQRQYLTGYKQRGEHNPAIDGDCVSLIEGWIEQNYSAVSDSKSVATLADSLGKNPDCKDGIVLTVSAVESPEWHEAQRRIERAVAAFEKSQHKAYPKLFATVELVRYLESNSPRRPALDAKAVALFKEALTDGSIGPDDQSDIAESLLHGWAASFFTRNSSALIAAAKEAGTNYQWLAEVLDGDHEISEAWRARGSGYSDSVSANGWREFERHLKIARSDLTSAWKLRTDLPQAPARMMSVALGSSDIAEMRLWFDRATAAQIDYPQAWSVMRWGLRPRWYGDTQSMLDFGVTALNTKRYDTDVPRKFFDSLNDLAEEEKVRAGEYLFERRDIWPHLQEMYEGYISANKGTPFELGWRSTYITVACLARKYDLARQQLEVTQWQPKRYNFKGWHRDLSLLPEEVSARTDPLLSKVDEAEKLRQENDPEAALKLFAAMSAVTGANERSKIFIRDRVMSLNQEQALRNMGFVHFMPQESAMLGWVQERGQFKVLPNGDLEVHSDKYGHAIFSRANVGWSFEVTGEFEVVETSSRSFQGGIVFGLPELDSSDWYAFRIKRNQTEGDVVSVSDGWSGNQVLQPVKLNDKTNSFTLRMTRGKVTATVNGQQVFDDVKVPTKSVALPRPMYVGLGAYNDMNDTVIRYHDIEVKRLPRPTTETSKPTAKTRNDRQQTRKSAD